MDLSTVKEYINKSIMSSVADELYLNYRFVRKIKNIFMVVSKDNKEFEYELIDFNSYVEEGYTSLYIEEYQKLYSRILKDVYDEYCYFGDDSYFLKDNRFVYDILDDNDDLFEPDEGELESIDTRVYIDEYTIDRFWEPGGGYEELKREIQDECPDIVATHYKGKEFNLYRRLTTERKDIEIPYIDLDIIIRFLIDREVDLRDSVISSEAKRRLHEIFDGKENEISRDEYNEQYCINYDKVIIDIFKDELSTCYDQKTCWNTVSEEEINRQVDVAVKIIEDAKNNLIVEGTINRLIYGCEYYCTSNFYDIINDNDINFEYSVDTFLDYLREDLYNEGIKNVKDFESEPESLLNKVLMNKYVEDKKIFKFKDFEVDFIEKAKDHLKIFYGRNFKLIFDEDFGRYYLRIDGIDNVYHFEIFDLIFDKDCIDRAVSYLYNRNKADTSMIDDFCKKILDGEDFCIKLEDSLKSGNCLSGSIQFCKMYNLPYGNKDEYPAKEFVNIIKECDIKYVLLAFNALRRAYIRFIKSKK